MKKVISIFLFVLFVGSKVPAQVHTQTGSATFSLPMFEWKDTRSRLNTAIALNYNSGNGLRVNDMPSNVGQNWHLMVGGVIARLPVGLPDDQKPRAGNGTVEDITKYPAGYLYDTRTAWDGCAGALAKYPIFGDKNHLYKQHNAVGADKELDYFSYQFNGRSGIFVLPKDGNYTGYSLGENKLKISVQHNINAAGQGIRTTITAFIIQDENGMLFRFDKVELTKVLRYNYCDKKFTAMQTQPKMEGGKTYFESAIEDNSIVNPYVVNSWYLTEIKDPLTQRAISFNYGITRDIVTNAGTAIQHYKEKDYSVISYAKSHTQTPELTFMQFPDGHQIFFTYGKPRVDINGAYALESIEIKFRNRFFSKFQLETSYFILNRYGNPTTDYQKANARLCLLSVKKYSADLKESDIPYQFDYYMGSNSPDDYVPGPFTHLKDIWGFYNGDYSRDFNNNPIPHNKPLADLNNAQLKGLCFLRSGSSSVTLNPKPGYAKNGLLKKIIYPTGKTLSYEYAQNRAELNNQVIDVGGVHVSRTLETDGGYSNDCTNPLITTYDYTLDDNNTQPSLWGVEMPVNSMTMNSHYEPESRYFYYKPIFDFGCDYRFQYPGIMAREQALSLTTGQKILLVLTEVLNVVGGVMTIVDVVSLCLKATPAAWVTVAIDIVLSIVNVIISCTSDRSDDFTTTVCYNSDLNSSNPLPTQFKRVVIREGSVPKGSTILEYTNSEDHPIWVNSNPSFSMKQRFAPWAYGLLKKSTVKDVSGNTVKETINNFYWGRVKVGNCPGHCEPYKMNMLYPSCKCLVTKSTSQRSNDWSNPAFYDDANTYLKASNEFITVDFYDIYTGRVELIEVLERSYKPGQSVQYIEARTEYGYNITNYLVNTILTTQSNGDKYFTSLRYTSDFNNSPGIMTTLNQNNVLTLPVVTSHAVITDLGSKDLSERVTEYTFLPNGDVKPSRAIERRWSSPDFQTNYYRGPGDPANATDYIETNTFTYDAANNLIGSKDEGNRYMTHIYDHENKFIVATAINAVPGVDKIAYTSFETTAQGESLGGWTQNGFPSGGFTSTFYSATGASSFSLFAGKTLASTINSTKPYRLSFWSTAAVNVTNATLAFSGPVINNGTYYEYNIAPGVASVSITGNAFIDELRLYPQAARLRTATFDPFIGKTSDCDENNRITYYEYDALGRLQLIKDEHRNIVKMYEYNHAQNRQHPCNIVYYNKGISETYTRNCEPGYIGSEVTYMIPPAKYSSTISQAAADLMAENELNLLAQIYANQNGTCIQLHYNTEQSQTFTKQNCPVGTAGTSITYTVPAGKYSSTIDVADANNMALEEIEANGQAFANIPGNASCAFSTTPVWEGTGLVRCQVGTNGLYTGNQEKQVKDMNPNSSTYNQLQWINVGSNSTACPPGSSPCIQYTVSVPYQVETNLYIEYTPCNSTSPVLVAWSMIPHNDDPANQRTFSVLCITGPPSFRYGPSGDTQFIPEISVVAGVQCN